LQLKLQENHLQQRMLKALFKNHAAESPSASSESPFDLAGEWVPVRHDEWYNRLPGKHSKRARSSSTKMTYDSNGNGCGWVGEVYVDVTARSIAPGHYNAKFQVRTSLKTLPWTANDGNLTLLEDGTLQVQYPSHGIREYWRRVDGRGAEILQLAREQHCTASGSTSEESKENDCTAENIQRQQRPIALVFRHFGDSLGARKDGYLWHWGLRVGDSIYEVNGAMAVMGPNGIVAASTPLVKHVHTNLSHFHGYVDLPHTTRRTDEAIESFSRDWVRHHPIYQALGPNCQTYAEDLFTFLTGADLPFAKTADKVVGKGGNSSLHGPEQHSRAVWLDGRKRPRGS